ncbi:MAG TPA: Rho termination factor N-terminal domain-containing protein, partial [Actinomycetes bacterium]|nr:Rho termination factor N-terminal domain-containing protein [Actinomycetes bacterium]
ADRVLAPMTEAMPRKQMRELGGRYTDIRDAVLRDEGADAPPPRRLDVSRAELYELAKRAGIEGRSSMSRRDLINELQRQQQQPS